MTPKPPHLLTLADLSVSQIQGLLSHARYLKQLSHAWTLPATHRPQKSARLPPQSLFSQTIALLFTKRSTRTRLAAESASTLLGGRALFLAPADIQLGPNESLRDTARVVGGMCQGVFARVGAHAEVEELARSSPVPVINALSDLWHPTQALADLMTLEEAGVVEGRPLKIAYVGDSTNVLHDILVSFPRLGHHVAVATPPTDPTDPTPHPLYATPKPILDRIDELGITSAITFTTNPQQAVSHADVIVTDTWVSMGQENEYAQRLTDFAGFQVTEQLGSYANPAWRFLHCLPRKANEVDDHVFYGPRSLVFPEADNRKWTIMALFDLVYGRWSLDLTTRKARKERKKREKEAEETRVDA